MSIRFFDMFAGIGGFRSGLEAVGGFECVGFCEIDKYASTAYRAMYDTEGEYFCADARQIDPATLPDIDLICGGFPCQSFSLAGRRRGFEDARGTLFFEIARIAKVKRPPYLNSHSILGIEWEPFRMKCSVEMNSACAKLPLYGNFNRANRRGRCHLAGA